MNKWKILKIIHWIVMAAIIYIGADSSTKSQERERHLNKARCDNGVYAQDGPECTPFWEYIFRRTRR